jgi:hypothetical protein
MQGLRRCAANRILAAESASKRPYYRQSPPAAEIEISHNTTPSATTESGKGEIPGQNKSSALDEQKDGWIGTRSVRKEMTRADFAAAQKGNLYMTPTHARIDHLAYALPTTVNNALLPNQLSRKDPHAFADEDSVRKCRMHSLKSDRSKVYLVSLQYGQAIMTIITRARSEFLARGNGRERPSRFFTDRVQCFTCANCQ